MSEPAKVAVALLNYRNPDDTLECLESLRYLAYRRFAVVVVDCASGDDSLERMASWAGGSGSVKASGGAWERIGGGKPRPRPAVRRVDPADVDSATTLPLFDHELTIIASRVNPGFAGGCNLALRLALGDHTIEFFWLLNNDTIVHPEALDRLVTAASERENVGAVGAVIADYADPDRVECLGGGRVHSFSAEPIFCGFGRRLAAIPAKAPELDYVSGTSCLVPRSTLEAVGLLDESMFLYWEDTDWSQRMLRAGLSLHTALDAIVWHKGHSSTGGINAFTKFHHFRSATIYMRRHRRLWMLPVLYRLAKNVIGDLLRVQPRDVAAAVRGFVAGWSVPLSASPFPVAKLLEK